MTFFLRKNYGTIQRRAAIGAQIFKDLSYQNRLHNLSLTTLDRRRKRGDLIVQDKCPNRQSGVVHRSKNFISERRAQRKTVQRG